MDKLCADCSQPLASGTRRGRCIPCRFWSNVDKTGPCWVWTGFTRQGYGSFSSMSVSYIAHRYAYELLVGPVPSGMTLDHLCRNRACVDPEHLEPVSSVENVMRGMSRWAINARKTHCVRGHEFTPENTRTRYDRYRHCRTCQRQAQRDRRDAARQLSSPPSE